MHNIHTTLSNQMRQKNCYLKGGPAPMTWNLHMLQPHLADALHQWTGLRHNDNFVSQTPHCTSELNRIELRSPYLHCMWIYQYPHANLTFRARHELYGGMRGASFELAEGVI